MKTGTRDFVLIYLNGQRIEVRGDDALMMLADWLRKRRGLTGTKIVCAEGDCGACSVLRAFQIPGEARAPQFVAINSCITTVAQMDASHIVTVEGLALGQEASPVQTAMTKCHASQCGFCTPGFVVALTAVHEANKKKISAKQGMNGLTGNLCRCTGYLPIVEAACSLSYDSRFALAARYLTKKAMTDLQQVQKVPFAVGGASGTCVAPSSEKEALTISASNGSKSRILRRVLAAGTDLGVQQNKGKLGERDFLSLHLVSEFYRLEMTPGKLRVGARVTLEQLRQRCEKDFPPFAEMLNIFASPQIKNVATLVGNIANGSPIGDTLPLLMVVDAEVHLAAWAKGKVVRRSIPLSKFYLGYRKTAAKEGELITHVTLTPPKKFDACVMYKVSQRKDLDISALSAAFHVTTAGTKDRKTIKSAKVAFGGVAATAKRVEELEELLSGASVANDTLDRAVSTLARSLKPISDARASAAYRKTVSANLLRRFWEEHLQ